MSGDTVYANATLGDSSQETKKAMETEEVTYSDITIIKTAKNYQNGSVADQEDVIYSKVNVPQNVPANDLDSAAPADPSAPAKPDPADSSLKPHPQKEGHAFKSFKCTEIVLLSVCVLLLAVAVTVGVLYIMKEGNYSDMEEEFRTLEAKYKNISDEKMVVDTQLSDTKSMLEKQNSINHNLTEEINKLTTELREMRECAPGWEYFNGKCYYFSSDERNWTKSRDTCVTMGGHLVITESDAELEYIKMKNEANQNEHYWIGLTQDQPEGNWYWVDNTLFTNTGFWAENQPDNSSVTDPVNGEDCAMTGKDFPKSLNDDACNATLFRICESKSCSRN